MSQELISLDWLTWLSADTSRNVNLAARADKSRWVDWAVGAEKSRQVDLDVRAK